MASVPDIRAADRVATVTGRRYRPDQPPRNRAAGVCVPGEKLFGEPGLRGAFAEYFERAAQSVILCLESRGLVLQSLDGVAQIGVLLARRLDFSLLFLNRLDDGREQFAVGNAVGPIFVVLPFDQRQPVFGFRSLDGFV